MATFEVRCITKTKYIFDIHMKANFEENTILISPKIIAMSNYTIKCRSFDYHINNKIWSSVMSQFLIDATLQG